eukprot:TRINITY_DN14364_c0_g1_i2.p1 TRINITY_DN14364_c0_g1~~TRINITY_DN14364_c0_g1_i2.p1  ORF type:complete len:2263 (-),score=477.65 TRINITY_DN14364_c0_g1_i2:108-6365(-)
MVHCDALYESLYDLLNQHYMEYAGQRYVRIAHGSMSKQCPIHAKFRVIVVVEEHDAYHRLAAPLLNRFEKQVFHRADLMTTADLSFLARVTQLWGSLLGDGARSINVTRTAIAGYHSELLASLVFALRRRFPDDTSIDVLAETARTQLLWVLTPEAVCLIAARRGVRQALGSFDIVEAYFKTQRHVDLPTFTIGMLNEDLGLWGDAVGAQVVTMTYSPLRGRVSDILLRELTNTSKPVGECEEIMLHELSSSLDLEKLVVNFYKNVDSDAHNLLLIRADTVASSLRMIEYTRFVCEKARAEFIQRSGEALQGKVFVVMVVHLERSFSGFSFDFDSQWQFAFLDSIEPAIDEDSCGLPGLSEMLNTPLLKVLDGCDFPTLLRRTFREALARLVYPHRRHSVDLQAQVQHFLSHLNEDDFIKFTRDWALQVLSTTKKKAKKVSAEEAADNAEGTTSDVSTVGEDTEWFADVATAAHELTLCGTLRTALHHRILAVITSLLTALMSHLDRNSGFVLLADPKKRDKWMHLAAPSLTSPMSVKLHMAQEVAAREATSVRREVPTDARTPERPFNSAFPFSWFVSKTVDNLHPVIKPLPPAEQLPAMEAQFKLTQLHAVNFDPVLEPEHLEDYILDFTAMHTEWMPGVDRLKQAQLLRAVLMRAKGGPITSVLEVHSFFWLYEQQVRFCIGLVDAVPQSLEKVEELINTAPIEDLNASLLLAVHRMLIEELATEARSGTAQETYRSWLHKKIMVAGLTKDFFEEQGDGGSQPALITELRIDTEPRIDTLALWVRHVGYPLSLPKSATAKLAADLPNGNIRSTTCFGAILQAVDRTRSQMRDTKFGWDCVRSFTEAWILEVCLGDPAKTCYLDETCVRLFCHISAGFPVTVDSQTLSGIRTCGLEGEQTFDLDADKPLPLALLRDGVQLPRLKSFTLALLRKLLRGLTGEAMKSAISRLEGILAELLERDGHNDSVFAKDYATVREENAAEKLEKARAPSYWPRIALEMIGINAVPDKALLYVGFVRWMLTQYALQLCKLDPNMELIAEMETKVMQLLNDFSTPYAPLSRSLRLFVMKTVKHTMGVTYLRGILATPPICESEWIDKMRNQRDLNFDKFIGSSKVPTWSPFIPEDSPTEFDAARTAVLSLVATQSSSTAKLEALFASASTWTEEQRRKQVGALLLALLSEPGILSALEEVGRPPLPWRAALSSWLATSPTLPANTRERNLLRIFAGDTTNIDALRGKSAGPLKNLFVIWGGRPLEVLFMYRVLGHLAASIIAAPPTSLLATFRTLMLEPEALMSTQTPDYLPSMDEDIRHRIQRAFGQAMGYSHANHWYKCTACGNKFYIGECSKPMQEAPCSNCGAKIGGQNHRPTATTAQDDATDTSPVGYTLPPAQQDENQLFFRDIHATSARIMRFLLHGAMCCGLAAHAPAPQEGEAGASDAKVGSAPARGAASSLGQAQGGAVGGQIEQDGMSRVYALITNEETTCKMLSVCEAVYLTDHLLKDYRLLADQLCSHSEGVATSMHLLLQRMVSKGADRPMAKSTHRMYFNRAMNATQENTFKGDWSRLTRFEWRGSWEETLDEKYLLPLIESVKNLDPLMAKWNCKQDESGPLVAELSEWYDRSALPQERRRNEMPQVLAYRSPLTLSEVQRRLPAACKEHDLTVLSTVLQTHILETMTALRTLKGQFLWHSLVERRFSGRISRDEAADITVGHAIETQQSSDRGEWEQAYHQVETAWQGSFSYVDRYECLEIPANLKSFSISKESAMVCAIADETGMGICPLLLTQWLLARHNDLVQAAALAGGYPVRKESSTTVGHHDMITYDKATMMRFIRDRCVTHGAGGQLDLDLVELERHLRHEFARPELSLELQLFKWLGEDAAGGNELRNLIPQALLSPEVEGRLRAEIRTPVQAARCMQKLQMTATFIVHSREALSSKALGQMKLSEYLEKVLQEEPEGLPSATARSEVYLCHLDHFVQVVRSIIHNDPMEPLNAKYKAEISTELEAALRSAAESMKDQVELIAMVMERSVDYFRETTFDGAQNMSDWLPAFIQDEDSHCSSLVEKAFPAELKLKHWEATYRVLKKVSA